MEKDLELVVARKEEPDLGCGPMFWKVIIEEFGEGVEGKVLPKHSLSAESRGTPNKVVWLKCWWGGWCE